MNLRLVRNAWSNLLGAAIPALVMLGTVLLIGTIVTFVLFARRALKQLPPELLGLATAGVAGIAFMIPDFLIGTPFPQVRTTQMLAICLALPYLAMAVAKTAPAPKPVARPVVKPFVTRSYPVPAR
jgi:hypothetical protein